MVDRPWAACLIAAGFLVSVVRADSVPMESVDQSTESPVLIAEPDLWLAGPERRDAVALCSVLLPGQADGVCSASGSCSCEACARQSASCGGGGVMSNELLGGLLAASDPCFEGFISPMTNPVYFEDPRTLTEARLIYLRHKVPLPVGGGDVQAFAVQLRAALNDRLSVIATKDGFVTSTNPLIDDGWFDINAGLKYNLYARPCCQTLLSGGVTYELPVGSSRTQQGNGDGRFNIFLSGCTQCWGWNVMAARGFLLPANHHEDSTLYFSSTHVDHRLGESDFFFLAEANWYSYLASGDGPIQGVEGGDLFSFGSRGVTGHDIVTGALGLKYKPNAGTEIGIAWEKPLSGRRDVLDNRLTVDWILRY